MKRDIFACAACPLDALALSRTTPKLQRAYTAQLIMEDPTMIDGSQPLFDGLTFTVIPNSIPEDRQQQVQRRVCLLSDVPNVTYSWSKISLQQAAP